ncbi:MAG: hypothetical protein IJF05_02635 [Clostridia bacterium]|nr:hypothetical protein [Clostridia bacterium]
MTGEVIITSQKKLGYDIDDGVITDALESVLILSTSHEPRWKYVNGFSDSLVMSYDDVINPEDKYAYNSELAQRVAQLVRRAEENPNIKNIYSACDGGQSRSAGIAAAIVRYLGGEDLGIWDSPHYKPNPLVYRLTCEAFGIEVTDEDITYLVEINEKTFDDAIAPKRTHANK